MQLGEMPNFVLSIQLYSINLMGFEPLELPSRSVLQSLLLLLSPCYVW